MKNIRIKCKTIEEAKKVLQMIEDRHPEVKWGEGQKPTEYYPWERRSGMTECWLSVDEDHICYTTPDTAYKELWVNATSAKRFLRKTATSIHIYQRGKRVIAHESETGREGIAKCSPDDKFDFSIGARIALLRLFGEEVPDSLTGKEKIDEKEDIKEGDTVEIVNSGKCYANYSEWVARNVEDKEMIAKYAYRFTPGVGTRGTVIKIADHGKNGDGLLVYINDDSGDGCFLIGIKGVKKIEP